MDPALRSLDGIRILDAPNVGHMADIHSIYIRSAPFPNHSNLPVSSVLENNSPRIAQCPKHNMYSSLAAQMVALDRHLPCHFTDEDSMSLLQRDR